MAKHELINVEVNDRIITTTPFQLLQWKYGLRLEAKGMKLSRGQSVKAYLKKTFGLKRTTKIEDIQAIVDEILEQYNGAD